MKINMVTLTKNNKTYKTHMHTNNRLFCIVLGYRIKVIYVLTPMLFLLLLLLLTLSYSIYQKKLIWADGAQYLISVGK